MYRSIYVLSQPNANPHGYWLSWLVGLCNVCSLCCVPDGDMLMVHCWVATVTVACSSKCSAVNVYVNLMHSVNCNASVPISSSTINQLTMVQQVYSSMSIE